LWKFNEKLPNEVPGRELNVDLWFRLHFILEFVFGCKDSSDSVSRDFVSQLISQLITILTALDKILFYAKGLLCIFQIDTIRIFEDYEEMDA
jgi:hypothetical protein